MDGIPIGEEASNCIEGHAYDEPKYCECCDDADYKIELAPCRSRITYSTQKTAINLSNKVDN